MPYNDETSSLYRQISIQLFWEAPRMSPSAASLFVKSFYRLEHNGTLYRAEQSGITMSKNVQVRIKHSRPLKQEIERSSELKQRAPISIAPKLPFHFDF